MQLRGEFLVESFWGNIETAVGNRRALYLILPGSATCDTVPGAGDICVTRLGCLSTVLPCGDLDSLHRVSPPHGQPSSW